MNSYKWSVKPPENWTGNLSEWYGTLIDLLDDISSDSAELIVNPEIHKVLVCCILYRFMIQNSEFSGYIKSKYTYFILVIMNQH